MPPERIGLPLARPIVHPPPGASGGEEYCTRIEDVWRNNHPPRVPNNPDESLSDGAISYYTASSYLGSISTSPDEDSSGTAAIVSRVDQALGGSGESSDEQQGNTAIDMVWESAQVSGEGVEGDQEGEVTSGVKRAANESLGGSPQAKKVASSGAEASGEARGDEGAGEAAGVGTGAAREGCLSAEVKVEEGAVVVEEGAPGDVSVPGEPGDASVTLSSEGGTLGDTEDNSTLQLGDPEDTSGDCADDDVVVLEDQSSAPTRRSTREKRPPPRNVVMWNYGAQLTDANAGREPTTAPADTSGSTSGGDGADGAEGAAEAAPRPVLRLRLVDGRPDVKAMRK